MEEETNYRPKPPKIPVCPMTNIIIVERINVQSKIEKKKRQKAPDVIMTKQQIAKMNDDAVAASNEILDVWDTHPFQGEIVAIDEKIGRMNKLNVGDKVAWTIREGVGNVMIFNGKKYICLFPHDILHRYLTDKA